MRKCRQSKKIWKILRLLSPINMSVGNLEYEAKKENSLRKLTDCRVFKSLQLNQKMQLKFNGKDAKTNSGESVFIYNSLFGIVVELHFAGILITKNIKAFLVGEHIKLDDNGNIYGKNLGALYHKKKKYSLYWRSQWFAWGNRRMC